LIDAWTNGFDRAPDPSQHNFLYTSLALIESGPETWSGISRLVGGSTIDPVDPSSVTVLTPLAPVPSLRDFLAFEDHVKNGAARRNAEVPAYWYEAPIYYKGNHRQVIGPEDLVSWPGYSDHLDFELELAMIVGRRGRDIDATAASSFVFGFTVMNDLSARDVQSKEMSAWLGPAKGKDFATSLGPCIVTADEVGSEPDLAMICRVNGQEWNRARSRDAYWTWASMLAHVSAGEDVYPGDVYGSGTPGGCCGLDLGRQLDPGDVVELEIESIGVLRNTIGEPPRSA
jgi:2-keto-4-pentenoate hydratase/2-oxohepta-3-ene-1,7-dioic acid hydratase in catechol pathway